MPFMNQQDFARAIYDAVQENKEALYATGQTSPQVWHDIKRQLVREHPRDYQQVIDISIAYNGGVYSENELDRELYGLCATYGLIKEQNELDKG